MKQECYQKILMDCGSQAKLIIVSKYRSEEQLLSYYHIGHKCFAENRVQELCIKHEHLPEDIEWHMIGHLQRNKVKYIVPFIATIHSVHSLALMDEIEKQAAKVDRIIPICIQFNLAKEDSKSGFAKEEWEKAFAYAMHHAHLDIIGIMVIGAHCEDKKRIEAVFQEAQQLLLTIKNKYPQIHELSMGMSQDYGLALKHGSTMIRIGSLLF